MDKPFLLNQKWVLAHPYDDGWVELRGPEFKTHLVMENGEEFEILTKVEFEAKVKHELDNNGGRPAPEEFTRIEAEQKVAETSILLNGTEEHLLAKIQDLKQTAGKIQDLAVLEIWN